MGTGGGGRLAGSPSPHRSLLPAAPIAATQPTATAGGTGGGGSGKDGETGRGGVPSASSAHGSTGGGTQRHSRPWDDVVAPWVVFFMAAFTRYYRLDRPAGCVFDEVHFGKFTGWYLDRKFYFDIHPPLGKLTFWLMAVLTGYDQTKCRYENLSEQFAPDCRYYNLRFMSASFSVATCVLLYHCARNFGCTPAGAFLAAALLIFDGLNLGEGRLVLMDAQLIFWCVASLWVAQLWWRRLNEADAATAAPLATAKVEDRDAAAAPSTPWYNTMLGLGGSGGGGTGGGVTGGSGGAFGTIVRPDPHDPLTWYPGPTPRKLPQWQRYAWCVGVGWVFGNAANVKMTGGATPFVVAIESFFGLWFLRHAVPFSELLVVLAASMGTYAWWFACSFALMTHTGPNKVEQEFMTPLFQSTLIGSDNYDPTGASLWEWRQKEGFWWTMITHNARMIKHNAAILEPHHWQSAWWEWILNLRGVAYYGTDEKHGYGTQVYLLGNPVVLWSMVAVLGVTTIICALYLRYKSLLARTDPLHPFARQVTYCLVVYVLNLLPYVGVARSTFIYHYMPALIYAQIIAGRLVDAVVPRRWRWTVVKLYLLPVIAAFVFYAPWIYGFSMTRDAHDRRRWMPRWN